MIDKLKGFRTYIVLAVALILGVIDSWNQYCAGEEVVSFCRNIEVPGFVFSFLAAIGIYTRRLTTLGR